MQAWLQDVVQQNPEINQATQGLMIWNKTVDGKECADWAYLNCETEDLEYYVRSLQDVLFQRRLEDFMTKHIGEYVEYIE
jgi:hypothetical protein